MAAAKTQRTVTRQQHAVPAALRWLGPGGQIVTLIKPHYEAGQAVLDDEQAREVTARVLQRLPEWGVQVRGQIESPVRGGKANNREWLAWLEPVPAR